jgi:6-phosphogluconolactonase
MRGALAAAVEELRFDRGFGACCAVRRGMFPSRATFGFSTFALFALASACSDSLGEDPIGMRGKDDPAPDATSGGSAGSSPNGGTTPGGTNGSGTSAGGATTSGTSTGGTTSSTTPPKTTGPLFAYGGGYSQNIAVFSVNASTGAFTAQAAAPVSAGNPSFLAVNPTSTNLYAANEQQAGRVSAFSINAKTGALTALNDVSSKGSGPAHVSVDATGKWVFVANYTDGAIAVLPVQANGSLGEATDTRNAGANAHQIVMDPSHTFVFVPCKGADYVAQYTFDKVAGKLSPNTTPTVASAQGAGPRHIAFHPTGKFAYVINELNSTMTSYSFDGTTGRLTTLESLSTLPAGFNGNNTGAEVWVHPSGKWVLGSNRGHNSLVVFGVDPATGKLSLKGHTPTGGNTPRHFGADPLGGLVYAANQDSGTITAFKLDAATGALTAGAASTNATSPSFIGLVNLP